METLTATLATLVAIWFLTCVAFYVHANTQDKTIASYKAYGTRLVVERDTLNTTTHDLLEAFNTVTAERDRLMLAHIAISDAYTAECDGAYCDRQALNAMTTECNELRTELEQSKAHTHELRTELAKWASETGCLITNTIGSEPATFAQLEMALCERLALANLVTALVGHDEYRDASETQADLLSAMREGWSIAGYAEAFVNNEMTDPTAPMR